MVDKEDRKWLLFTDMRSGLFPVDIVDRLTDFAALHRDSTLHAAKYCNT